jgi:hypothetical protein
MGLQKGLGFVAITNFWYGKLPFQAIFLRPDLITTEVRRQMQFRMTIQKEMEIFKREQVVPSLAGHFPTQHACTCIRCCKDSVCWTKPPPTLSIFQQTVHSVKYKSKQKKRVKMECSIRTWVLLSALWNKAQLQSQSTWHEQALWQRKAVHHTAAQPPPSHLLHTHLH